jgi:hypothetical protein
MLSSTAPQGAAPLQVTSTTLVTNLNAEFVGGKRAEEIAPRFAQVIDFVPVSLTVNSILASDVAGASGTFSSTGRPLFITLNTSAWQESLGCAGARIEYSIVIDGQSTVMGQLNFVANYHSASIADGIRQYAHFSKVITNVGAGTHNIKVRWRLVNSQGCAQAHADDGDFFQVSIIEGGL